MFLSLVLGIKNNCIIVDDYCSFKLMKLQGAQIPET